MRPIDFHGHGPEPLPPEPVASASTNTGQPLRAVSAPLGRERPAGESDAMKRLLTSPDGLMQILQAMQNLQEGLDVNMDEDVGGDE